MPRLHKFFGLSEMARTKEEPIKAVLDWAAQQKGTFTISDLYKVYVANGGRANSEGDNKQSFTTQIMKLTARFWKDGEKAEVSEKRPLQAVTRGSRGGGGRDPTVIKWGLGHALREPGDARFVNPDDDNNSGEAMDRLEKALSYVGKGLPPDPKAGRQKLQASIERWKKMKSLNQIVADIRGSIPKKGQMDALHIASEFLMDRGQVDQDDVEDAEAAVAPAPSSQHDDDHDDGGDFSDEPSGGHEDMPDDEFSDTDVEPEEEPAPAPVAPKANIPPPPAGVFRRQPAKPAAPPTPTPEPDDDDLELDDDDIEEPTKQQAGAANFIKPPAAPPAAPAPPKKSPVSKFFPSKKK